MSKMTIELRFIVNAGIDIFDFNYPFYDENKRKEFEQHFIEQFYFNSIAHETIAKFKHRLKVKLNNIMPYYNEMFETNQLEYDKLNNYNVTEKWNKKNTSEGQNEGNSTNSNSSTQNSNSSATNNNQTSNLNKYWDTPQGRVSEIEDHITALTSDEGSETNTSSNSGTITNQVDTTNETFVKNTGKDTEDYERTMIGNIGVMTSTDLLEKHLAYQKKVKTIELQIWEECRDLFSLLY